LQLPFALDITLLHLFSVATLLHIYTSTLKVWNFQLEYIGTIVDRKSTETSMTLNHSKSINLKTVVSLLCMPS